VIKITLEDNAEPLIRQEDGVTVAVAFEDKRSGIIVDIPMNLTAQRGLIAALEGKPLIEVAHRIPDPPAGMGSNGTH
jgi:hypothetical protein